MARSPFSFFSEVALAGEHGGDTTALLGEAVDGGEVAVQRFFTDLQRGGGLVERKGLGELALEVDEELLDQHP
jgi:hypothetical protein